MSPSFLRKSFASIPKPFNSSEVDLTTPPNQLPITDDLNTMNSLEETMKRLEVLDKDDDKDKARATILYSLKKPPLQTVRMEPDSKQEPLFINCQGSGLELTTDLDESNFFYFCYEFNRLIPIEF